MLPHSYNGWPASPRLAEINCKAFSVLGVEFPSGVRGGDVATVMRYVVKQMHLRVEKLHPGWCWGACYRVNRNDPNVLSNHASATAVDYNAPAHPNGVKGTWSAAQRAEIQQILAEVNNVVASGEFFHSTTDGMHLEISADAAAVHQVALKLSAKPRTPVRVLVKSLRTPRARAHAHDGKVRLSRVHLGLRNADVLEVQRLLNRWYPNVDIAEDGKYGVDTQRALARAAVHLRVRGAVSTPAVKAKVLKRLGFKVITEES